MSRSSNNAANQSQVSIDTTRILVKHFPLNFSASDKWEFLKLFGAIETKGIGRTAAIAQFPTNVDTKSIINLLHQRPINGQILHAEFAKTNPLPARTITLQGPSTTTENDPARTAFEETTTKLQQYLQALKSQHDFDHPPPHNLREEKYLLSTRHSYYKFFICHIRLLLPEIKSRHYGCNMYCPGNVSEILYSSSALDESNEFGTTICSWL